MTPHLLITSALLALATGYAVLLTTLFFALTTAWVLTA